MIGILIIKFGRDTKKKEKINCLILTGKSAKLKCSKFSTQENHTVKMQRKNGVLQ